MAYQEPAKVMDLSLWPVKGTGHDAIVTVHPILDPEEKAFFWIDVPLKGSGKVGHGRSLYSSFPEGDSSRRAVSCAFFACFTKSCNPEWPIGVMGKGKVRENLAYPDARTKFGGDKESIASQFSKAGGYGQWYGKGRVVTRWNRLVPKTPDKGSK